MPPERQQRARHDGERQSDQPTRDRFTTDQRKHSPDLEPLRLLSATSAASRGGESARLCLIHPFYADVGALQDAIRGSVSATEVRLETVFKVDIFVAEVGPFDRAQLCCRRRHQISEEPERHAYVASPEDTVLAQLGWYYMTGESSVRQWRDVLGVLRVQSGRLDVEYLRRGAAPQSPPQAPGGYTIRPLPQLALPPQPASPQRAIQGCLAPPRCVAPLPLRPSAPLHLRTPHPAPTDIPTFPKWYPKSPPLTFAANCGILCPMTSAAEAAPAAAL